MIEKKLRKVVWASMLGNALELYDYTLYGYFAAILAAQFFSTSDPITGLLMTYGIYASGFLFRPVGALFFGAIGDRYGRKRALELSILMMAVPTLLIGHLPTYAAIGIAAPILLTVLRLFQGMSVGGELVGSFTYLVEHAPAGSKGYVGSWTVLGAFGGKLVGTTVATVVTLWVAPDVLAAWGWRIPFILGLGFAVAGYRIRRHVEESPVFLEMQAGANVEKTPLRTAIFTAPKQILQGIGIIAVHSSVIHLVFIYFPVFLKTQLNFGYPQALFSTSVAIVFAMIGMPIGGHLSDRFGRQPVMFIGAFAVTVLCIPAFHLVATASIPQAIVVHGTLSLLIGLMHGPFPTTLNELFPATIRYSAAAISYNIGVLIFGGMAPFMATKMIAMTGNPIAPAYWIIVGGVVSMVTLIWTGETSERNQAAAFSY